MRRDALGIRNAKIISLTILINVPWNSQGNQCHFANTECVWKLQGYCSITHTLEKTSQDVNVKLTQTCVKICSRIAFCLIKYAVNLINCVLSIFMVLLQSCMEAERRCKNNTACDTLLSSHKNCNVMKGSCSLSCRVSA